ncbi:alkaline phosphatase [Desulfofundulus thermosubterraneus]|uniref:Alkaline phosphatase n=1 Tax=Desulfofundulus thermosubterraneus DSM 16057 TaxID=1121432 RepID=A0A1M6LN81_9FIRM|nr:alkaline phosphatase [Desulfofundulus thermosubterraneus]SHJ72681.1 alkaline phosphatase [Desulfofundulus thermosubterraneus DSM 16057]
MTKTMKRIPAILVIVLLLLVSVSVPLASAASAPAVKNVILMIPDGMSVGGTTLARWYKGGTPLAMDEMACGLVRTYSSDAAIADSAPAATAFSTGFKSHTGYVAVLPDVADMPGLQPIARGDEKKPVATILEAAKLAGKATGLVVTCEIPHATPAAFSAHYPDRNNYDDILEQQVYSGTDVVLGGGSKYLTPEARKDKEDLIKVIKDLGYDYVTTPEALRKSTSNKLWGMFAPKDLSYDFDRDPAKQPSLAEMTSKAIEVLSKDKDGFFLMVEGSKIDWAAHANDPVGVISDILAFDNAVKVALDFAKKDKHTVVIAVTDHGNGGITIGDRETSKNYDELPLSIFIEPLKRAKLTGEGVEKKLNADRSNIKEVMATYYGITDLTKDEIKAIKEAKPGKLNYVVGPMLSKRAHIGWTTNGHTGEDVVLYVYSPTGDRPTGVIENIDIAKYMERILGLNLQETTKKLFVPAEAAFPARGARVEWDDSDPNNPVFVVTRDNDKLKLPINKNLAEINGKLVKMNGLTVYNGVTTFVPQEALDLMKALQ